MKLLHAFIRACSAAFLLLALLFGAVPRHAGAAAGNPSLAGHWVAHVLLQAEPGCSSPGYVCTLAHHASGPVTFAGTMDIVSNAAGRATFTYELTLAGAGSGVSPQCNANLWASTAFTGLCPLTSHGNGFFPTPDGTSVSYFNVSDEWVTFHGTKLVREAHNPMAAAFPYPAVWTIPAQPGYYHDYLPGVGPVATGMHAWGVVARY